MISKDDLTRLLRDASDLEEGYIGFLTEYTRKYFDWTGYDPDKVATAKKIIDKLNKDSARHNRIIEDMLTWVSGRGEDGF